MSRNLKMFLIVVAVFVAAPIWIPVGTWLIVALVYLSVIGFAFGTVVGVVMLIYSLLSND